MTEGSLAIGVALGFTSIEVAALDGDEMLHLPLETVWATPFAAPTPGGLPSVVAVDASGKLLIGGPASQMAVSRPERTIAGIMRLLALDASALDRARPVVWAGLSLVAAPDGGIDVEVDGRRRSLEELTAFLLSEIKRGAEQFLGCPVREAVITIPSALPTRGRKTLSAAATAAGLELRKLPSPVEAVARFHAGALPGGAPARRVAICVIGGGSFEVAVAEVGGGREEVVAHRGSAELGGVDVDTRLLDVIAERVLASDGLDLRSVPSAARRLSEDLASAKAALSSRETAKVSAPFIAVGPKGPVHLDQELTRADVEAATRDLGVAILAEAHAVLRESGKPVVELLLVGGMSQVPLLRRELEAAFGRPHTGPLGMRGAVAAGAALLANAKG